MHNIVKITGGLSVGGGILCILAAPLFGAGARGTENIAAMLWIALPLILSGAVLYCFGAIVEHLIAIRANTEKQLAIFDRLGKPKGEQENP